VDNVMVLRRTRGQNEATVTALGRDLEDKEYALSFDPQIGTWVLVGDASELRMSRERQEVLDIFRHAFPEALGPTQAARSVKKDESGVRRLIYKLVDDGHLSNVGYGKYRYTGTGGTSSTGENESSTSSTG